MKHMIFLTALLSSFCTLHAADQLCAREDFSRFDPGTYKRRESSVWDIREENGIHFRRLWNRHHILEGWHFIDNRESDYILHIRFRIPDEKKFKKLTFEFHITQLESGNIKGTQSNNFILNSSQLFFSASKTKFFMEEKEKLPAVVSKDISPALQQGVWYDLHLRTQGSSFSAVLKENDTVKGTLETKTAGESGQLKMISEGDIDIALIESFAATPN